MYPTELNFRFKALHHDYCILCLSVSFELSLEPSGDLLSIGLIASELFLITHSSCLDILSSILKNVHYFKKFIIYNPEYMGLSILILTFFERAHFCQLITCFSIS